MYTLFLLQFSPPPAKRNRQITVCFPPPTSLFTIHRLSLFTLPLPTFLRSLTCFSCSPSYNTMPQTDSLWWYLWKESNSVISWSNYVRLVAITDVLTWNTQSQVHIIHQHIFFCIRPIIFYSIHPLSGDHSTVRFESRAIFCKPLRHRRPLHTHTIYHSRLYKIHKGKQPWAKCNYKVLNLIFPVERACY
jgi:hypothetical protein